MQLLNRVGTSDIIINVAFATVTDYTFIWIIQDVQTFLLIQKFSFKCPMTPEMSFKILNYLNAHTLHRNCLLQQVIEGKIKGGIEVTGRRGRKCRKLLDDLKERRGYSQLKEEALDRTMWTAQFGRGFGPVIRQTIK